MDIKIDEPMVRSFLTNVLKRVSKKTGIELKQLRVQLKLNDNVDNVNIIALEGTKAVSNIKWDSAVGAKYLLAKSRIVQGVFSRLIDLAEKNEINNNEVNMRVYAIDQKATPRLHLYNGTKAVKTLNIIELI